MELMKFGLLLELNHIFYVFSAQLFLIANYLHLVETQPHPSSSKRRY